MGSISDGLASSLQGLSLHDAHQLPKNQATSTGVDSQTSGNLGGPHADTQLAGMGTVLEALREVMTGYCWTTF